jgi:ABC-type branched-subunit amino acid transport system substrate-binding protein
MFPSKSKRLPALWAAFGAVLALSVSAVRAEDGVTASEIRIGMSNALSGPASGLGTQLKAGAEAYIAKVNAAGGVHGRRITLVSKDDGYEPARCAANTEALVGTDKVFALFGYVGTPTSTAAVPIAAKAQVPYLFPFTGAEFLRNPVNKWVFNVRASYFDETEEMVERLTKDLGIKKIAMFMQDDAFGEAVKGGIARALFKRDMKIHAETRFKRNTMEVDEGVAAMKQAAPEAIVFVGTYKQLAAVVKKAKAAGVNARFLTVSFIGTENFIAEAGADGDGVYITQVMPSPQDAGVPLVKDYLADMKGANVGYTSLEGYVNAAVLVEALKKAGPNPTRAGLVAALEAMSADLGGIKVAFSATNHQGSKAVWLTQVRGGKAVPQSKMQ